MKSTTEKACMRGKDPIRTGLIITIAWLVSIFVVILLAVWLTCGKENREMNSAEGWIATGCIAWIFVALAGMSMTYRIASRHQDKQTAATRELILRRSDGIFKENFLNIAFQPGEPDRRLMMYRKGEEGFSLHEATFSGEKWLTTGRIWQADDEGELWAILMDENISETVWNLEDDME